LFKVGSKVSVIKNCGNSFFLPKGAISQSVSFDSLKYLHSNNSLETKIFLVCCGAIISRKIVRWIDKFKVIEIRE
jgi:hypothetical protein